MLLDSKYSSNQLLRNHIETCSCHNIAYIFLLNNQFLKLRSHNQSYNLGIAIQDQSFYIEEGILLVSQYLFSRNNHKYFLSCCKSCLMDLCLSTQLPSKDKCIQSYKSYNNESKIVGYQYSMSQHNYTNFLDI